MAGSEIRTRVQWGVWGMYLRHINYTMAKALETGGQGGQLPPPPNSGKNYFFRAKIV